jgi:hypothetical protein
MAKTVAPLRKFGLDAEHASVACPARPVIARHVGRFTGEDDHPVRRGHGSQPPVGEEATYSHQHRGEHEDREPECAPMCHRLTVAPEMPGPPGFRSP